MKSQSSRTTGDNCDLPYQGEYTAEFSEIDLIFRFERHERGFGGERSDQ